MAKNKKKPRAKEKPTRKKTVALEPIKEGHVQWSFQIFDNFRWLAESGRDVPFREIAQKLRGYESMRWTDIETNRWRDHPVKTESITPKAYKRLETVKQDDVTELWRFRFNGLARIWGTRVGDVFMALWWDPEHLVCPSNK